MATNDSASKFVNDDSMALYKSTRHWLTERKTPYPAIDPKNPAHSAAGKTVMISGGATGIGFSAAKAFAQAGADNIILLARRANTLDDAAAKLQAISSTTKILTYPVSITDAGALEEVFADVRRKLDAGKDIDIIVTSAASFYNVMDLVHADEQAIRDAFDTNLFGNLKLIRNFLPKDVDNSGKIVLEVSTVATLVTFPATSVYGASKGAFTHLMRNVQLEHPEVRIHSLNPGTIFSPAAQDFGLTRDMLDFDHDDLPGQFMVWLASPVAEFLKGRFVLSCWDVDELVQKQAEFKKNPALARGGLVIQ